MVDACVKNTTFWTIVPYLPHLNISIQQELHECLSIPTSNRMKAMAENLEYLKLLERLSEGDMVTTEAKYHSKCFLNLFNHHCKHICNTTVDPNNNQDNFIEGMNKPYIFQT